MSVVWVLVGIVVLGAVAVVAAGRGDGLPPAEPDRPDLALPADRPIGSADVDRIRFSVGLRGYRMDEVDEVLDRVAADVAARDELIDRLEQQLATRGRHAAAAEGGTDGAAGDAAEPSSRTMLVPVHELSDDAEVGGATTADPQAPGPDVHERRDG